VPNDHALVGAAVFGQAVVVDPVAGATLTSSFGVRIEQ